MRISWPRNLTLPVARKRVRVRSGLQHRERYAVVPEKRAASGLEGVLREIFPIESYDKNLKLEYIRYELGKPRYDPEECRQLRTERDQDW